MATGVFILNEIALYTDLKCNSIMQTQPVESQFAESYITFVFFKVWIETNKHCFVNEMVVTN